MNAPLHTPGPWSWETPMGEHCPWIVPAGQEAYEWKPIATLGDCLEEGPSPRSKAFQRIQADARLIAAAPELLGVLCEMFEEGPVTVALAGNPTAISDLESRARAAIAKALAK